MNRDDQAPIYCQTLHDMIKREFDGVNGRLDKINGRIVDHDREITGLKVRDAYWAGAVAVLVLLVKMLID